MSLPARVRVVVLGLLFLGLVVGRLSSVLAPIAAAFAPAVCRVCHGCGVAEHDDVCDCDACHALEEGRPGASPSVHEPAHVALAADPSFVTAPAIPASLAAPLLPSRTSWIIPPSRPDRLSSKPPTEPLVPPPRQAA